MERAEASEALLAMGWTESRASAALGTSGGDLLAAIELLLWERAPEPVKAPAPSLEQPSWAHDRTTNLQRGLASGTLAVRSLPMITIEMSGVRLKALCDTGAQHCAISEAAVARCGLAHLVDVSFAKTCVGGIGGNARRYGRLHYAQLQCGDAELETGFDVICWPPSANDFDAIIGLDLLARAKAKIDLATSMIELESGGSAVEVPLLTAGA